MVLKVLLPKGQGELVAPGTQSAQRVSGSVSPARGSQMLRFKQHDISAWLVRDTQRACFSGHPLTRCSRCDTTEPLTACGGWWALGAHTEPSPVSGPGWLGPPPHHSIKARAVPLKRAPSRPPLLHWTRKGGFISLIFIFTPNAPFVSPSEGYVFTHMCEHVGKSCRADTEAVTATVWLC